MVACRNMPRSPREAPVDEREVRWRSRGMGVANSAAHEHPLGGHPRRSLIMSMLKTIPMLLALTIAGCTSPADRADEAVRARHDADKKIAEATEEAREKEVQIEREASDKAAKVAREGAQRVGEAEGVAEKKAVEASAALQKERNTVHDAALKRLSRADEDVTALRAKIDRKLSRAEADQIERDLQAKASAARGSVAALDTATADDIESVKRAVDARLADLDRAITDARKRL
jgi:DNA-binding helix-hairpin-helix protein with protein kinase domain